MGMYDTILVPCPSCGTKEDFQTKSGSCAMAVYELDEAPQDALSDVNRHGPATCRKCKSIFGVELTTVAAPKLIGTGLRNGIKADMDAVLDFVKDLASQSCDRVKPGSGRCKDGGTKDVAWMCPACAAHHLVYVGNNL